MRDGCHRDTFILFKNYTYYIKKDDRLNSHIFKLMS